MDGAEQSPLRELIRTPVYWNWEIATQLLRLPAIMTAIAYVYVSVDVTGSPALGGLLLAATVVAAQVTAPFTGRFIDRLGLVTWGPRLLMIGALGRLVIAFAFLFHSPTWLLFVLVTGFSVITSGGGGTSRAMLGRAVPNRLLSPAFAVDATLLEICVVSAPFLVTVFNVVYPVGSLFLMSGITLVGALMIGALGRRPELNITPDEPEDESDAAPAASPPAPVRLWRNPQFVFWLLVGLAFGHLIGTADIAALPLALLFGHGQVQASVLIGVLAAASASAGLAYAAWGHKIRWNLAVQTCLLLLGMVASGLAISAATSYLVVAVAYIALGTCVAPINTVRQKAIIDTIPPDRRVEAFSAVDSFHNLAYAFAGIMVAVLSTGWFITTGTFSAILALLLAPVLVLGRRPRRAAKPAEPAVAVAQGQRG